MCSFLGAMIASEVWELMEIVAAETYGLFAGISFVETNRAANYASRPFVRNQAAAERLQKLFGTPHVHIRQFENEDGGELKHIPREWSVREDIVNGWIAMGMTPDDVGYIVGKCSINLE